MMSRLLFLGLAFYIGTSTCIAQEPKLAAPGKFEGEWTVDNIIGYGGISGGPPEAKRLLGKTLRITSDGIDFNGEHCRPNNNFTVHVVDTASRLKADYDANLDDIRIPPKTLLLDSENCTTVFRMDDFSVVFGWDGVMVRAYK
jgi:hypothetical protein